MEDEPKNTKPRGKQTLHRKANQYCIYRAFGLPNGSGLFSIWINGIWTGRTLDVETRWLIPIHRKWGSLLNATTCIDSVFLAPIHLIIKFSKNQVALVLHQPYAMLTLISHAVIPAKRALSQLNCTLQQNCNQAERKRYIVRFDSQWRIGIQQTIRIERR